MSRAKIINFELLCLNKTNYTEQELSNETLTRILDQLRSSQGYDTLIGLLLLDGFMYKNNDLFLTNMKVIQAEAKKLGYTKIILITGMCEDFDHVLKSNGIDVEIWFFDFWQNIIYQSYKDTLSDLSLWNVNSNQFLFLGGIPSRANRIVLLSKFYDDGIINDHVWSFFPPWVDSDQAWCRQALPNYSNEQYEKFLKDCTNSIDEMYKEAKNYSKLHGEELFNSKIYTHPWVQDPSYIDPKVFNNTVFSVISEGNAYPPAADFKFITEKTWRAVINRHPFIIAGYTEQTTYARQRGLRTFNQYFPIADYDTILDENARLDAVVTNTKHFLEHFEDNAKSIQDDINHNYNLFFKVRDTHEIMFNTLKNQYQVSEQEIVKWFENKSFVPLMGIEDGI
jgi:hypothetical protein